MAAVYPLFDFTFFRRQLKSPADDRMKIRPRRRHQTTTNPVKSLQQRNDVRTDTEVANVESLNSLKCH